MPLPKFPQISVITQKVQHLLPKREAPPVSYAIVDVGASMVRAAITLVNESGRLEIIGVGQIAQDDGAMYGGIIGQLDQVIETVGLAIDRAASAAGMTSDQVVLGFGGALVGGVTTQIHLKRPQPKDQMQEKELALIFERICQTALVDAQKQVAEELGIGQEDLRLINSAITSMSLDGYALLSPLGFSGKEMEVCLFNAFTASSTLVALQKLLTDLSVDLSILASEPYALAQAAVRLAKKPAQASMVVLDVGAGTSSVTLVDHGSVVGSRSFMIGGNAFTDCIGRALGIERLDAERAKRDYVDGTASTVHHRKVSEAIEVEFSLWMCGLTLALAEFEHEGALPPVVLMSGSGARLPEFENFLGDRLQASGLFAEKPKVSRLQVDQFKDLDFKDGILDDSHVTLAALSLLVTQRRQEDEKVSALFQKTLQTLL